MGFLKDFVAEIFGIVDVREVSYQKVQQTAQTASQQTASQAYTCQQARPTSAKTVKVSTATTQPVLVKEPDDLGTPELPRLEDVDWLDDEQKMSAALKVLDFDQLWFVSYHWRQYYQEKKSLEEIVSEQNQESYDLHWEQVRKCWRALNNPFWSAYVAGHFPNPEAVRGNQELAKEVCIFDAKELKYRQKRSLIKDGVYTLGMLRNSLFNDRWCPTDTNDRDKWYFRQVLMQYGLEMPPSEEPDPVPFVELYIGAVFGLKVTPEKRLRSFGIIQGDEPFEDRVRRAQAFACCRSHLDDYEDIVFYLREARYPRLKTAAIKDARECLEVKKILMGGAYVEPRSSIAEGVDLDELKKVLIKDLDLSSRARLRVSEYSPYRGESLTLADLVQEYEDWLLIEETPAAVELKEYLYQHGYVIRPEEMPMDERTPINYLGLPTRIRQKLYYPGYFKTAGDLINCYTGKDPRVFTLRDAEGIGKKSIETIRVRLTELGLLADAQ